MTRNQPRFARDNFRELPLHGIGDFGVETLAGAFQQGRVGSFLDKRMLELVKNFRFHGALEHQFRVNQPANGRVQLTGIQRRDHGEHTLAECSAEDRGQLRDLFDRTQSIQPCHQRVLKGRRNGQ